MRASLLPILMLAVLPACTDAALGGAPPSWHFVLQAVASDAARPATVAPAGAHAAPAPASTPSPSPTPRFSGGGGSGGAPSTPTPPNVSLVTRDGGFADPSASPTLQVGP